jgi:hypothetical protein
MKKIFLTLIIVLTFLSSSIKVLAATPVPAIFDYECQRRTLLSEQGVDENGNPKCNLFCDKSEIFTDGVRNDLFCPYGEKTGAKPSSEIFGSDYAVNEFFIPQEDAAIIYLRSGFYVVLGLAGLLVILYGLYGWYVRSMSAGSPDKVELSMSIFKNALIGSVMIIIAVVVVQLVYSFLGITQGAFDFNFIPKIGTMVDVNETDIGRKCYTNQSDINGQLECVEGQWQ